MPTDTEKLQKVLARAGLGSRREIEAWIAEGRITVDGRPARLGDRVSGTERIEVNGRRVAEKKITAVETRVIAYHKPEGELVTRDDPEQRATVFAHLPPLQAGRWIAIGRLDLNTSGLLLFTTDGELANALMHPSRRVEREYAVRVHGVVPEQALINMTQGVQLEDGPARFEEVTYSGGTGANHWYYALIVEGRKREVRRLWESQGLQVSRLMRVRFGPYQLPPSLRKGRWRDLTPGEANQLREAAGLAAIKPPRPPKAGGAKPRPRAQAAKGHTPAHQPAPRGRRPAAGKSPWKGRAR